MIITCEVVPMKTKYWLMILGAVLAVCLGLSFLFLMPGEDATHAEILSGGTVIRTVDLRIDQEFTVASGDSRWNVVTVKDGRIAVTEATCPDHYCMHRGFCSSGAQIVCLPNKLVIRFVGEPEVDMVLG